MLIDFSKLDMREAPVLLLSQADGTPIQPLGYAMNIQTEFHCNEVSVITFDLPKQTQDGPTPGYDQVVGMQYVQWPGIGLFILMEPKTTNEGIVEMKSCTLYSSEYEFTYKTITLENSAYNFWNPAAPDDTLIGRILERMPSWSVGEIDEALIGRYRVFEDIGQNIYNFLKSTAQEKYGCLIDFDTLNRKIYATAFTSPVATKPVYLSLDNLAKKLEITENTEDILTCLDMNGADGVDIRSVNPLGTNKIYDLGYFLTEEKVGAALAAKWTAWNQAFKEAQTTYFSKSVEHALAQAKYDAQAAKVTDLEYELKELETLQSTYVSAEASGIDMSTQLAAVKAQIAAKQAEIDQANVRLASIQTERDNIFAELSAINQSLAFSKYFTSEELLVIDRYTKEDAVTDSSFVVPTVNTYDKENDTGDFTAATAAITQCELTKVSHSTDKDIYSIIGGSISCTVDGKTLSGNVIRGAVETGGADKSFLLTAYLGASTYDSSDIQTGCVTLSGTFSSLSENTALDSETGAYAVGTSLSAVLSGGYFFLSRNNAEFEQRSVEWDLFDYGLELLARKARPSYTFSVESCNFLALEEFEVFKNQLAFAKRIYLDIDGKVLEPICIGAKLDFEDLPSLELEFGDTFYSGESTFAFSDLLEKSVSMGKQSDFKQFTYNQYMNSGDSNRVRELIEGALDASVRELINSVNQDLLFDQTGLRIRKKKDDGGYEDNQIWITNNGITFTTDGWLSAKMAIGRFTDTNLGTVDGIIAPSIVGTLLAGENLVIESTKKDGQTAVFRVDGDGAKLYNSLFDLVSKYTYNGKTNVGQISLNPTIGLITGNTTAENSFLSYDNNGNITGVKTVNGNTVKYIDELTSDDRPQTKFWVDMEGNVYFDGNGTFNGDGNFSGTVNAIDFKLNGTSITNIFKAETTDDGYVLKIGNITIDGETGEITFNGSAEIVQVRYSTDKTAIIPSGWSTTWNSSWSNTSTVVYAIYSYDGGSTWTTPMIIQSKNGTNGSDASVPSYITRTKITTTEIESPNITGNYIRALRAFLVGDNYGFMGYAQGAKVDESSLTGTTTTHGVALAASDVMSSADFQNNGGIITYETQGHYIIATTDGVRLQAGSSNLVLTQNGLYLNGAALGAGEGTQVVAVWG